MGTGDFAVSILTLSLDEARRLVKCRKDPGMPIGGWRGLVLVAMCLADSVNARRDTGRDPNAMADFRKRDR